MTVVSSPLPHSSPRLQRSRSLLPTVAAEVGVPEEKGEGTAQHRTAERSYSMFKVRRGGGEEIPHVQGKKQWL